MHPGLFHPGGHFAQGAGSQHPVDDQGRNRLPFRYAIFVWTAGAVLADYLDQPDLSQVLQYQSQSAYLVGLFLHPLGLEGDYLLYIGWQRGLQSLDLLGCRHFHLRLRQLTMLPGLHPSDQASCCAN